MKKYALRIVPIIALSTVFTTATATAQMPSNMSEQDMQKMMAAMQDAQACYEKIDKKALQALQQQAEALMTEVNSLCRAGKRAAAQERVISYARSVQKEPTLQQARRCLENMPESITSMIPAPEDYSEYIDEQDRHVCD